MKSFKKEVEEINYIEEELKNVEEEVSYERAITIDDFPKVFDVKDPDITDWKYYDNNLIVESNKDGTTLIKLNDEAKEEFEVFINKILDSEKKTLNVQNPERDVEVFVEETDIKLRFNFLLESITTSETKSFCCRKNSSSKTLTDKELEEMINEETPQSKKFGYDELKNLVSMDSLPTILFVGATGTAKTTVQKKLFEYYPEQYSIFTIQDTNDLNLRSSKKGNIQEIICKDSQEDGYDFSKGVVSALRWNPDVICISEIRKEEVVPFIEALETGHAGNTTVHAKSPEQAIKRITNLYNKHSTSKSPITEEYITTLIDVIIHLDVKYEKVKNEDGDDVFIKKRYIKEVKKIGDKWK